MLEAAADRLYALLKDVWPSGVRLLDPDEKINFETALGPAEGSTVVVRYYSPQLLKATSKAEFRAYVDVCARRLRTARSAANLLLAAIPTTARDPTGVSNPTAVPNQESSYWRVSVGFTLIVASVPEPQGS